jgi:hypothetical protein
MFADKGFVSHLGRTAMIAGVAATVLTSVGPSVAVAAPATKEKGQMAAGTSGATDFSAQRRYYRGGYYRGGGAAAAAAFAGIVGTGIAIAAANARRDAYYDSYGYYGGPPVSYYPADTYYYGGGPYYGGYRSGVPYYRGHPLAGW